MLFRSLLSYIRLRDGTFCVPSLDGFRAAAPMHSHGLMNQPMTAIRVGSRGGDRLRPSGGVSCYAILGKLVLRVTPRDTFSSPHTAVPPASGQRPRGHSYWPGRLGSQLRVDWAAGISGIRKHTLGHRHWR